MTRQFFLLLISLVLWVFLGALSCNREEQKPITMDYLQGEWQGSAHGSDYTYRICQDSFFMKQVGLPNAVDATDSCWDTLTPPIVYARGQVTRGSFSVRFRGHYTDALGELPPTCSTVLPDTFIRDYSARRNDGGLSLEDSLLKTTQLNRVQPTACPVTP